MKITYEVPSMAALADELDRRAGEIEERAEFHAKTPGGTKRHVAELRAEAKGMRLAASITRDTVIVPPGRD